MFLPLTPPSIDTVGRSDEQALMAWLLANGLTPDAGDPRNTSTFYSLKGSYPVLQVSNTGVRIGFRETPDMEQSRRRANSGHTLRDDAGDIANHLNRAYDLIAHLEQAVTEHIAEVGAADDEDSQSLLETLQGLLNDNGNLDGVAGEIEDAAGACVDQIPGLE